MVVEGGELDVVGHLTEDAWSSARDTLCVCKPLYLDSKHTRVH